MLRCVQSFRAAVLDPLRSAQSVEGSHAGRLYAHSRSISLQSLIAHYVNPVSTLESFRVRTAALEHLCLTCQLWQNCLAESVRPDLVQLLSGLGARSQLETIFCTELELGLTGSVLSLPQGLAFLDLLLVAAQSQPSLLELLFNTDANRKKERAQLTSKMLHLLEDGHPNGSLLQEEQLVAIKFKLAALLCHMAKKQLCVDFVVAKDGNLLAAVFKNVIDHHCFRGIASERVHLDGHFLDPLVPLDSDFESKRMKFEMRTRVVRKQSEAKVVLCLYLQMLVGEFSRDPAQPWVRKLIASLWQNDYF